MQTGQLRRAWPKSVGTAVMSRKGADHALDEHDARARCVGLWTVASAAPAATASELNVPVLTPGKGVSFDFGSKRAVGYFLNDRGTCKVTLMLAGARRGRAPACGSARQRVGGTGQLGACRRRRQSARVRLPRVGGDHDGEDGGGDRTIQARLIAPAGAVWEGARAGSLFVSGRSGHASGRPHRLKPLARRASRRLGRLHRGVAGDEVAVVRDAV
jgi:hypothetical protein